MYQFWAEVCDGALCAMHDLPIQVTPGAIESVAILTPQPNMIRGSAFPIVLEAYDVE